jgi:hypothetical protein
MANSHLIEEKCAKMRRTDEDSDGMGELCRLITATAPERETLGALGEAIRGSVSRMNSATSLATRAENVREVITALRQVVQPGLAQAQAKVDFILKAASAVRIDRQ